MKHAKVLDLKPCQFAIGMLEIEARIKGLKKLSKPKLKRHINKIKIPIVISPEGELFMTDHHHFLFACSQLGVKRVRVKVLYDLSNRKMSWTQFWAFMKKHQFFYPKGQFGDGPRSPLYLPLDILGCADDPYRSLAWLVREEKGYKQTSKKFAEFKWANFFRDRKLLHHCGRKGFEKILKKAVALAKSSEAKGLPGFLGGG